MKIYVKAQGYNHYYWYDVSMVKTNRGYWKMVTNDYKEISRREYYKQSKENRVIINFWNWDYGCIHEIGNKKLFEKLLDKWVKEC